VQKQRMKKDLVGTVPLERRQWGERSGRRVMGGKVTPKMVNWIDQPSISFLAKRQSALWKERVNR
jgi:hypothetical protein